MTPDIAPPVDFTVVIPARYGSTRLPGKPLKQIAGKPMVQHVYERARESGASRIVIATDDKRIVEVAERFGATVCMTRPDHPSGTDRLEEVVSKLALGDDEIVVNVQGDEPLIPAVVINQVAENLAANGAASIATLCDEITDVAQVSNPNVVKVVRSSNDLALYFSRAPIPWARDAFAAGIQEMPTDTRFFRHIGIYAYRVKLLRQFVLWPPSPPEVAESLEQLRALWHGAQIHVDVAREVPAGGIDTEEDLARVIAILEGADRGAS